jgi:hypothetical protein
MILCDLSRADLEKLWTRGSVWWRGYSIKYVPRKIFTVTHRRGSFRSTDIFPFFQCSFVKALRKWNLDPTVIEEGKLARSSFAEWSIEKIADYNAHEMRLLVSLADSLREKLEGRCGLQIKSYHGPGAVANAWFYRENAKDHFPPEPLPREVAYAYFGGRTDILGVGEFETYRSDLASAYPSALSLCISLHGCKWLQAPLTTNDEWALYHVRWEIPDDSPHGPLPFRLDDGTILYPPCGEGWYWGVELLAVESCFPGAISRIHVKAPTLHPHERTTPLKDAIEKAYATRQVWKNNGELAHEALKLVLNSLYGKLAQSPIEEKKDGQRSGGKETAGWRNPVWAGWITAWTRARITKVMERVGAENVLSIATDGVLLRVPNPLASIGNALGEWQNEGMGRSLIVCPGLYAHYGSTGDISTYKQRGLPGGLNYGFVLRDWGCITELNTPGANAHSASTVRFNGMGTILQTSAPRNQFTEHVRSLNDVTRVGTSKREGTLGNHGWISFLLALKHIPPNKNTISAPYKRLGISEDHEDEDAEEG